MKKKGITSPPAAPAPVSGGIQLRTYLVRVCPFERQCSRKNASAGQKKIRAPPKHMGLGIRTSAPEYYRFDCFADNSILIIMPIFLTSFGLFVTACRLARGWPWFGLCSAARAREISAQHYRNPQKSTHSASRSAGMSVCTPHGPSVAIRSKVA